jgi:predicted DNA binding CopG/RHH family protein
MGLEKKEHLEEIKNQIDRLELKEEEKSNSFQRIEEWYQEDRSFGTLYQELSEISPKIELLLAELGLI